VADLPRAAAALAKKLDLDPGWAYKLVPGQGLAERGSLSDERNERRSRHRIQELVEVHSLSVRARHADGRNLIAVWVRWADETGWKMNLGMHLTPGFGIGVPVEIAARAVTAYATAPDLASALEAIA
jgi:hypothetical protein